MPGDDSATSPPTPQVDEPSSYEPQEQASGRSTMPHSHTEPRKEDGVIDAQPDQLLHTTFPYKVGEDVADGEDTPLLQSPSPDNVPDSSVDVRVIDSIAHMPQYEEPCSAKVEQEQAPPDDKNEACIAVVSPQEAQLQVVESEGLPLPASVDHSAEASDASDVTLASPEVPPTEDSTQTPHADDLLPSKEPILHGSVLETIEEEKTPAALITPVTLPEPMAASVEDTAQIESTEEATLREHEGEQAPTGSSVEEPSFPDDYEEPLHAPSTAPETSETSEYPPEHMQNEDVLGKSPSPDQDEVEYGTQSDDSSSNDERTLDLVLQDREAWDKDKEPGLILPKEPTLPRTWSEGMYTLTNVQSRAALDISGGDHRSIIGWPSHGHANQQVSIVLRSIPFTLSNIVPSGNSYRAGRDT